MPLSEKLTWKLSILSRASERSKHKKELKRNVKVFSRSARVSCKLSREVFPIDLYVVLSTKKFLAVPGARFLLKAKIANYTRVSLVIYNDRAFPSKRVSRFEFQKNFHCSSPSVSLREPFQFICNSRILTEISLKFMPGQCFVILLFLRAYYTVEDCGNITGQFLFVE